MDPLTKLKLAVLGALVRSVTEEKGVDTLYLGFTELDDIPGVEVHVDPETKTLSVSLEDEDD